MAAALCESHLMAVLYEDYSLCQQTIHLFADLSETACSLFVKLNVSYIALSAYAVCKAIKSMTQCIRNRCVYSRANPVYF